MIIKVDEAYTIIAFAARVMTLDIGRIGRLTTQRHIDEVVVGVRANRVKEFGLRRYGGGTDVGRESRRASFSGKAHR
jgi:hypothetical protein